MLFQNLKSKLNHKINYLKEHRYLQTLLLTKESIPSSGPNGVRGKFSIFIVFALWLIIYCNVLNNIGWIQMDNYKGI